MIAIGQAIQWFLERTLETVFSSFQSWESLRQALGRAPGVFLNFTSGLAWPYLLSNLFMAWLIYRVATRRGDGSFASFREFAFPSWIYRHASTLLDLRFMVIELFMSFLFYVPIYVGIGLLWSKTISMVLIDRFSWEPPHSMSSLEIVCVAIMLVLLIDLGNYWGHVWCHRIPVLWAFHEVHHSAEVLSPATAYRVHPVENILFAMLHGPVLGLSAVLFQNIAKADRQFFMIGGATVIGFVFQSLGTHLKHSHIWFSFGPWLDRLFISPAFHQLHHSVDPRHVNKNFGANFAIWDGIFGTVCYPGKPERLHVGLAEGAPGRYPTVWQLYWRPFQVAAKACADRIASYLPGRVVQTRVR